MLSCMQPPLPALYWYMRPKAASNSRDSAAVRALPLYAEQVDRELARLSSQLDWIAAVSPINISDQWQSFKASKYTRTPVFAYRDKLEVSSRRERLNAIAVDKIEHPILLTLLAEKRLELLRLLELIELRETPGFQLQSIALFGEVEPGLLANAHKILAFSDGKEVAQTYVGVDEFVEAATAELEYYRSHCKDFNATIHISKHIAAGVMVSDGMLVVASDFRTSRERLRALLNHEIGTHILTWFNGSRQPLRQLKSGLAHYDATQEGLGVLAEYLCGNLPLGRLRTIAGRVVAVRALTEGADFVEIYRMLTADCGLSRYGAFITTARVFRGGGLTKDAVYLRGLIDLLDYLQEGHSLEELFIGKFSLAQLTGLAELQRAGWLVPACMLPRYWHETSAHQRIEECARGGIAQLLQEAAR